MNTLIDLSVAQGYSSRSQIGRIVTEHWAGRELYCPFCGRPSIQKLENNMPVADFICPDCNEQFELKSKQGKESATVVDGSYSAMINRIKSDANPNFIFLYYQGIQPAVQQCILVPKYFISTEQIQIRKPLPPTAKRAGWVGCTIRLDSVPQEGRIYIVRNQNPRASQAVLGDVARTRFMAEAKLTQRSWLLDTMRCIQRIDAKEFALHDVYVFCEELSIRHPGNRNIEAKLRQQLQLLQDRGFITFLGNGIYQKR